MNADLQKAYDAELARHECVIGVPAQTRLATFIEEEWDGTPLKLKFGMGTCYVEVNGKQAYEEDYPALEAALQDVDDITNGYIRACPVDIEVKKKRK